MVRVITKTGKFDYIKASMLQSMIRTGNVIALA